MHARFTDAARPRDSCRVLSGLISSSQIWSGLVLSRLVLARPVMSGLVMTDRVLSCHVSSGRVESCPVRSSQVESRQVMTQTLQLYFFQATCGFKFPPHAPTSRAPDSNTRQQPCEAQIAI